MRFLFFVNHDGFIRNFERLLEDMTRAGHEVHLAVTGRRSALMSSAESLEHLVERMPGLSFDHVPKVRRDDPLRRAQETLCSSRNYLRFLEPAYADTPKLTARAARYAPDWL